MKSLRRLHILAQIQTGHIQAYQTEGRNITACANLLGDVGKQMIVRWTNRMDGKQYNKSGHKETKDTKGTWNGRKKKF